MSKERERLVYEVVSRLGRGESRRAIARAMGIAPRTVRNIERDEERRRTLGESALERMMPARRAPRASKLDRFVERAEAWLEQYPDLTAMRLLEKLQAEGFDGQYTLVRTWWKARRAAGARPKRAVEVVETPPGQQGQFDWSEYTLRGCGLRVQLWSCTLSWSRGRSFWATDNKRQ